MRHALKCMLSLVAFVFFLADPAACLASGRPGSIRLKAVTIDTRKPGPAGGLQAPAHGPGARYFIVQLKGPVTGAARASLAATGARIISYVPDNAFLVESSPRQLAALRRLGEVKWTGWYRPGYKVSPRLSAEITSKDPPEWLTVLVFEGADLKAVLAALAQQGVEVEQVSGGVRFAHVQIRSRPRLRLERIAAIEGVAWIEPHRRFELINAPPPVTGDVPGELVFSGMGATRMACPAPAMDLERHYLNVLAGASSYSFLGGRLVLGCETDDGPVALIFEPREVPSETPGSDG